MSNSPVRRDPRLIPLSHDHHVALFRAREVVLAVDGVQPRDARELAGTLVVFFDAELARHFEAEERFLLPPFVARVGAEHPLAVELLRQHAEIRALAAALAEGASEKPTEAELWDRLKAWSTAITAHVRWEERQWFNAAQEALTEDEMAVIGAALQREGPSCRA
ncbi:MAG: hemerythrin domain-containing protein [Nitrospirota bacterium]|nr:hemerythrin domain-containing protein [Nitrospirota bacterium]